MAMQSGQATAPTYKVVWPSGRIASEPVAASAPVSDLHGKTVCVLWNGLFKGDEMFSIISEKLKARYPDMKLIDHDRFGNIHGRNEHEVITNLPARFREYRCDLAISGVGA